MTYWLPSNKTIKDYEIFDITRRGNLCMYADVNTIISEINASVKHLIQAGKGSGFKVYLKAE
ncbi:MAG: hypothetical protein M3N14_07440 [Bacteroidota bacterium]|nr:hypothetical protein [Bacteroidota bacterium]